LLVVVGGKLPDRARERDRQLAARVGLAEEDLRERRSALLPEVPALEDRRDARRHVVDRERPAADQEGDRRLARREHRLDEIVLLAEQVEAVAVPEVRRR